jgi:hypothetical protein
MRRTVFSIAISLSFALATIILLAVATQARAQSCGDLLRALNARIQQFNATCLGSRSAACRQEQHVLEIRRGNLLQQCR